MRCSGECKHTPSVGRPDVSQAATVKAKKITLERWKLDSATFSEIYGRLRRDICVELAGMMKSITPLL